ncbi:MAG: hypothetical protein NT046_04575, partial [Arenimonas sp.]|nr:hypothetical protein [Arenimonas sp.]
MRWTMGLLMALAAQAPQAKERDEQALLQGYAYQLAVAEAPGDVHSDQRLAKVLELIISARTPANPDAPSHSEAMTLFLARAQAVAAQLEAQVDAARDADPALLAADLGCWPRTDDTRVCDARRARLEALAGDNAYHGLVLMETAWMLEDAAGFLRAARLAAAAPEYDSWVARDYRSLLARYRQVPVPKMPG